MSFQMMRVISSPSISTTGFFTLILAMSEPCAGKGREKSRGGRAMRALPNTRLPPRKAGFSARRRTFCGGRGRGGKLLDAPVLQLGQEIADVFFGAHMHDGFGDDRPDLPAAAFDPAPAEGRIFAGIEAVLVRQRLETLQHALGQAEIRVGIRDVRAP